MAVVTKSPNQAAAQAFVDKVMSPAGQADLRQVRLPADHGAGAVDREGDARQGSRTARRSRSPARTSTGTTSVTFQGVPGEVQGRLDPRSSRSPSRRRRRPGRSRSPTRSAPRPGSRSRSRLEPTERWRRSTPACAGVQVLRVARASTLVREQPVDEADDRAGRLEPEANEDVLGADAVAEPRLERLRRPATVCRCWASSSGRLSRPARSSSTSFSRSSERTSRTWSTGSESHRASSSRPSASSP